MSTQVRGLNQASRNANDGISLAQTAEGALSAIGNNLQRIRELAVQSRNATNSSDDRAALQKEVSQLKGEIGRVANQTAFNGTKLLDGSFTSQAFQVGANQGQTINIAAIANANIDQLGTWTTPSSAAMTGAAASAFTAVTAGDIKINGINIGAVAAGGAAPAQGANVAAAINAMSGFGNPDLCQCVHPGPVGNSNHRHNGSHCRLRDCDAGHRSDRFPQPGHFHDGGRRQRHPGHGRSAEHREFRTRGPGCHPKPFQRSGRKSVDVG
jgi:hypothetical protein